MTDKQHEPATVGDKAILPALNDFTKLGGYKKGSPKRPADKDNSEGRDGKHDKFTEFSHKDDDEKHRQPLFKGDGYEGSATSDEWLNKDYVKTRLQAESFDVDLDAMQNLLESSIEDKEFVSQAMDIFKATLEAKVEQIQESMAERAADLVTESVLEIQETLSEQYEAEVEQLQESVEEYLDAVVLEWAAENKLAIQESTQTALAQSFMEDLKNLMEAYGIDVPETKVDLYEAAVEAGDALMADYQQLAESYDELLEAHQEQTKILATESFIADNDFSLNEAEQIRKLADNLEFTDVDSFYDKLEMIGESYIGLQESKSNQYNPYQGELMEDYYEDVIEEDATSDYDPEVARLLDNALFKK